MAAQTSSLKLVFTVMQMYYKLNLTCDKNQFTSHKFSAAAKIIKHFVIIKSPDELNYLNFHTNNLNTQIRNELVKRGLDEAHVETALKLVDRSAVAIDPATQSVVGADEVAKKFHEAHAGLGFFKKSSAGTNQSATLNITSGAPDYSKLSQEQKLKLLSTMKRNA